MICARSAAGHQRDARLVTQPHSQSLGERCVIHREPSKYAHGLGRTYFFQGASGNDKPDSKTMRSLDSTPLGNPLTTYANIA